MTNLDCTAGPGLKLSEAANQLTNHFHTLDFSSAPEVERAVLAPFCAKGDALNISGPPGCGKTTLAEDIIIGAIHPKREGRSLGGLFRFDLDYLGNGNIVVLDAENNRARWTSRLKRKMAREGLDPEGTNRVVVHIRPSDVGLHDARNWETSTATLIEALVANKARFIVGDSLARIWGPEDINSAGWVQRAYAPFRTACQDHGISILMLTHTPKSSEGKGSGPQGPIGSSFQEGQADGQLMLTRTTVNGQRGIKLTHRKSRRSFWIQQGSSVDLAFIPNCQGYKPRDGWETDWAHECPDYDALDDEYKPTNAERIKTKLQDAHPDSLTTSKLAKELGISDSAIRKHLRSLNDTGRARKVDSGPNTRWEYIPA